MLSPAERARADRFHLPRDRFRFTAAHGWLRILLSRYLDVDASEIEYDVLVTGKPRLRDHQRGDALEFNMSHSGDAALFALSCGRMVGIDIEQLVDLPDLWAVAKTVLTPSECRLLRMVSPEQQTRGFFQCWTLKEALVKAVGVGMSVPFDEIVVAEDGTWSAGPVTGQDGGAKSKWCSRPLTSPFPGYLAAVAGQGTEWRVRCFRE